MQRIHEADEYAPTTADTLPWAQAVHKVLPDASEYVPTGHCVQVEDAATALNVPRAQAMHCIALEIPATFEKYPAGHEMQVLAALPSEYLPMLQLVHTVLALALEYVPRSQGVQLLETAWDEK